jgi:hypothetical protein
LASASKAERLPRWRFRRFNEEQRRAYDRLRWYHPGPAERARLKTVLGWRRTREETVALAEELLDRGRVLPAIAAELGVSDRYLRRLLREESLTPENRRRKASIHAPEMALTRNSGTRVPHGSQDGRKLRAGGL